MNPNTTPANTQNSDPNVVEIDPQKVRKVAIISLAVVAAGCAVYWLGKTSASGETVWLTEDLEGSENTN